MRITQDELRQYVQFLLELERDNATAEGIPIDIRALRGVSWWQAVLLESLDRDAALFRAYVTMVLADLDIDIIRARLEADRRRLQQDIPKRLLEIESIAERSLSEARDFKAEANRIEREIDQLAGKIGRFLDRIVGHSTCAVLFSGDRPKSIRTLKTAVTGAKVLTICDPYLFHVPRQMSNEGYVNELLDTLPLESLKRLTLIHRGTSTDGASDKFLNRLQHSEVVCRTLIDPRIHDRVWMVGDGPAFLVGTSFGGIGNKMAFLVPLPDDDLKGFQQYVSDLCG